MQGRHLPVEALGVSGAPAPGHLTTTFRLPEGVVVDAGAVAHGLAPAEQLEVRTLILSHAHLDHTLGLPFLLARRELRILGLPETLAAVRDHLFNGSIWPELTDRAEWREVSIGERVKLGSIEAEFGPAGHTVPCLSITLRRAGRAVTIVGDTRLDAGVTAWVAGCRPNACIVEVSYPDARAEQAHRFGHQTPRDVVAWRDALGEECAIHVTHIKPAHDAAVRAECEALGDARVHLLRDGDVLEA